MASTSIAFDILARDRASKTFNKVGGSADSMGSKVAAIGKRAAIGFGVASIAAAGFLLKVGAPYVASLNKIQVLTDSSDAKMRAVAKTLEGNATLYAKMGLTTGDAAAGVVELTKAGMSLDASMKAVNATMVLAKAGDMSVADASTLVSNTLNTFGLKAKRAGDVANYLANAANISSADVADLAESFKYVSPLAAAAGVKVQTVNALLAELANKGIQSSVAGTGLRNMFLSLKSPSGAGGKAIKDLGVHVFDANGKARAFKDVLGDLGDAVKKVDDKTRSADLKAIFGKQGITAAQVLLEGGVKGLEKYQKGVVKAGAAQRFANASSKGLMGTLRTFKAEAVSAGQSLYRAFSPLVDSALRPLVNAFGDLTKNAGPALAKFTAQGPAKLKAALSGLGGSGMGQQLSKTGAALATFGKAMLPTLKQLGTQLKTTLGPGLKQIGDVISTQFLPAFRNILPVVTPVAKILLKIFGGALIGALSGAIKVIKGVLTTVSGVLNLIADLVHGRWGKVWGDLGQIVKGALTAVLGLFQVWWNVGILSIFKRGFVMLTKGIWVKGFEMLKGGAESGMKSLEGLFAKGLAAIGRALMAGVKGYLRLWKSYFNLYREVVVTGWKVLRSAFGSAVTALRSMVSVFLGGIRSRFASAFGALKGIVSGAIGAVRSAVNTGLGRAVLAFAKLPARILSALGDLSKLLLGAGKAIIQGLINGIDSMIGKLKSKLGDLGGIVKGAVHGALGINSPAKIVIPAGMAIIEGLEVGIGRRTASLKKALSSIKSIVSNMVDKLANLREIKAGFLGTFSGSSVFGADLSEGGGIGSLIGYEQQQAARAMQLVKDVQKLIGEGMSKSLLMQLQNDGGSGVDQIHALAQGDGSQIGQINALDAQTTAALQRAGLLVGNAINGGNIDSQIAQTKRDLALAQAVEKALSKIHFDGKLKVSGQDLVVVIKARNRQLGVASAGI